MMSFIAGWLVKRSLAAGGALTLPHARRIVRWGMIGCLVLVVALLGYCTVSKVNDTVDTITETARDAGATEAVVKGQNQTLEQLGDANDAEEALNDGGERNAARYAQCLQDSRRPAACERYNPDPRPL